MHPEFTPVALIAAISLLLPLPWHWRARNVATLAIIFWLFVSNIIYAVDATIWGDNVRITVPVWCDITTKLIIGANFALPAACFCICIHLEQVASGRRAQTSVADKRRRQWIEVFMTFVLPVIFMALHYIVQGHRFDIIEEYGCRPTTYFSIASIFITSVPPIFMAVASLIFAGLALRHFMLRRVTFAAHLASKSALSTSHYMRLILMSVLQMVWSLTVTSYTLWFTTISVPIRPWTTWAQVHSNFSRIDAYLTAFTPRIIVQSFYVLWWMVPASTFIFVAFFAFGHDAIEEYKKCFSWLTRHLPGRVPAKTQSKHGFITLPLARDMSKTASIQTSAAPSTKASRHSSSDFSQAPSSTTYINLSSSYNHALASPTSDITSIYASQIPPSPNARSQYS